MHRRLMAVFAGFTLGVTALFGLFAMAFVYSVEDRFLEQLLAQEAARQQAHHRQHGEWTAPQSPFVVLHATAATLPADLAAPLTLEPWRTEFPGSDGRHYHVRNLAERGKAPWLIAEVSQLLIVRPMRDRLLRWLAGWAAGMVALALLLAWWLARRTSAPLETLAAQMAAADPARLPETIVGRDRSDEIGTMARGLDALMTRTRDFIDREQSFTRDASHELRTPLAVMRMALERMEADHGSQPQVAAAQAAVRLMQQTVDTLLLLAREDAPTTSTPASLLPLVEKWTLAHEAWLDRQSVTLDVRLGTQDSIALPDAVAQLLLANLLGNAVAHGSRGGVIRITMEGGVLCIANPSAELPVGVGDAHIKGEASAGFGLGLSIMRRLLERYDGALDIRHSDGETSVRVVLPACEYSQLRATSSP